MKRLSRILNFVDPTCDSISDIGGHHGLLTAALVNYLSPSAAVYYIDVSPKASATAQAYFDKSGLKRQPQIFIGHGLEPLLEQNLSSNTLVISGIGPIQTTEILLRAVQTGTFSNAGLEKLSTKFIVLQPWPPNLTSLISQNQLLRQHGWVPKTEGQAIDTIGNYQHITTLYNFSIDSREDSTIRRLMPLFEMAEARTLDVAQANAWRTYLKGQAKSLAQRVSGFQYGNKSNQNVKWIKNLLGEVENQLRILS